MTTRRTSILKQTLSVAFATLLSRVLGLFRVMFESMVLGGGAVASAWQLGFMMPNLFRRLLGEGALGTALIPVIVHTEEREGAEKMRRDLAVVFAALGILLALISVTVSLAAVFLAPRIEAEYWKIALRLQPILMPYAFFICLSGVIGAVLNSKKEFFLPALGALLLNIFLIAGLAAGYFYGADAPDERENFLETLSYLVLVSGVIQLALLLVLLKVRGVFPSFCAAAFRRMGVLKELGLLVLPGIISGAALQFSFLADRTMASWLGPQAVPALTYTDRLVDLPIGLFAVGMSSVLMANMAQSAAKENIAGMRHDLDFGLRMVWFGCVPIAFYLILFREPLLRLLLFRGNFTIQDLHETADATLFLGMGLPFFCSLKVILPAFYARKKVFKPFCVSLICIALNLCLNYVLMWHLKQGGIALATVLSSVSNNSLLLWMLFRENIRVSFVSLFGGLARAVLCGTLAGTCVFFAMPHLEKVFGTGNWSLCWILVLEAAGFGVIYWTAHGLAGGREGTEFFRLLLRRNRKKQRIAE